MSSTQQLDIDGLALSANALELLQSCIKPLIGNGYTAVLHYAIDITYRCSTPNLAPPNYIFVCGDRVWV